MSTNQLNTRKPIGRRPSEGHSTFAVCLGGAALLCAFGLSVTWSRLAVVDRGYQLGRARAANEDLLRERAKLNLEIEAQQSAHKVENAAHALGMMKAEAGRVLVVKPAVVASSGFVGSNALASNGL